MVECDRIVGPTLGLLDLHAYLGGYLDNTVLRCFVSSRSVTVVLLGTR